MPCCQSLEAMSPPWSRQTLELLLDCLRGRQKRPDHSALLFCRYRGQSGRTHRAARGSSLTLNRLQSVSRRSPLAKGCCLKATSIGLLAITRSAKLQSPKSADHECPSHTDKVPYERPTPVQ